MTEAVGSSDAVEQDSAVLDRASAMPEHVALREARNLLKRGGRRAFGGRPPSIITAKRRNNTAMAKALDNSAAIIERLCSLAFEGHPRKARVSARTQAYACFLLCRILGLRPKPHEHVEVLARFRNQVAEHAAKFMFQDITEVPEPEEEIRHPITVMDPIPGSDPEGQR